DASASRTEGELDFGPMPLGRYEHLGWNETAAARLNTHPRWDDLIERGLEELLFRPRARPRHQERRAAVGAVSRATRSERTGRSRCWRSKRLSTFRSRSALSNARPDHGGAARREGS